MKEQGTEIQNRFPVDCRRLSEQLRPNVDLSECGELGLKISEYCDKQYGCSIKTNHPRNAMFYDVQCTSKPNSPYSYIF
ncbi:MAG: hypothetical protein CMN21_23710 [Rubinisphaera sp.]|nr:hypothetical protein [Rubinisphaera sp.]